MPELPEIHAFAKAINDWNNSPRGLGALVLRFSPDVAVSLRITVGNIGRVEARARGKQLLLLLHRYENDTAIDSILIGFGLTGVFRVLKPGEAKPANARFWIECIDGSQFTSSLVLVDPMKLASWKLADDFDRERSPDPMTEHEQFKSALMTALNRNHLKGPICEVMLDQKYFNGIGNYLRAEIMHLARVWPFDDAAAVLRSSKGPLLISLCGQMPRSVCSLGLNKYGTDAEQKRFVDNLNVYEKGEFQVDTKNRKVYYCAEAKQWSISSASSAMETNAAPVEKESIVTVPQESSQAAAPTVELTASEMRDLLLMLRRCRREQALSADDTSRVVGLIANRGKTDAPTLVALQAILQVMQETQDIVDCSESLLACLNMPRETGIVSESIATNTSHVQQTSKDTDEEFALPIAWRRALSEYIQSPKFALLREFVRQERITKQILPPPSITMRALRLVAPSDVRVVVVGQDPYHDGSADGLCFSVNATRTGSALPPSLRQIFRVLANANYRFQSARSGDLTRWAEQGVLLLNAVMTVEAHKPNSHANHGWEAFTSAVIEYISRECLHVVFMLWGQYAQRKADSVDRQRHMVLEAPHPSPLAGTGFSDVATNHFHTANVYLAAHSRGNIDWSAIIEQSES